MLHFQRMIESVMVPPGVSAAAKALRTIPSEKRTAASRNNLAKANAARHRKLSELDQFRAVQLPKFHRPGQIMRATGVPYDPWTMRMRRGFVRAFEWIAVSGDKGLTRHTFAMLSAIHLRPANLGRFVIEAIHHLKRCGLIKLQ